MTRPLRIEFPGGIYHVTSRGDRKEPIFSDDADRQRLLDVLAQALDRFDANVLAYCLMGNHYHLVLRTNRGNLSRLMRHVNGVYAQAFNRRHGLVGHLFQGRFTSLHVDRDAYLLEVCRYVELNPVRAHLVDSPSQWRWSSYRAHCGLEHSTTWLDTAALHGQLLSREATSATDRLLAARRYAQFVDAGRAVRLWERDLRQQIFLGDEAFVERIQRRARAGSLRDTEIPEPQRRTPLSRLRAMATGCSRDESLRRAYLEGGTTMTEIARALGLSVSRISRLIQRAERGRSNEVEMRPSEGARPGHAVMAVIRASERRTGGKRQDLTLRGEAKGKT